MSTFSAILEAGADGTLHVPVPAAWRHLPIRVTAELEPVSPPPRRAVAGLMKDLAGEFWIAPDFDEPLDDFREYME